MAKRRVVVTGMGAVTPIGLSVDEFWQNVKAQKTGFSEITKFDTTNYKCKLAAEVKEFDAKNYMDAKEARRMELFSQYAVAAAKEAIEDAGLEMDQEDPYMAGCAIGSGVGSLQAIEREHTRLIEKGPGRVGPLFVPMMISNMAAGNVSIHFGLKGKSNNVVPQERIRSVRHSVPFSMVRQTLWFPGEPREVSVRPQSLVLRHLRHSQQKPIRRDVPFRLIKNAAALSWERAQRWSY